MGSFHNQLNVRPLPSASGYSGGKDTLSVSAVGGATDGGTGANKVIDQFDAAPNLNTDPFRSSNV